MNEFIEKLIGRIMLESASCKVYKLINPNKEDIAEFNAYKKCIEIVNELAEQHKDNVMIDGQYCWQTCGATERCKECNRLCNGSIDYYENYDFMAEEHNGGWITDRNPTKEECGRYGWKWFQVTIPQVDGSRTAVMQYEYTTIRGKEVSRWKWYGRVSNVEPIAWKPLAEPYKPKGE